MAEFSVNVVTTAGSALIARATAASQLIYTRVLSDADAMTAAAAALATPADFSGPEGTILAASATDVSCRVVGRIGNQPAAATVKTFAVCAKIDGDASDVVVAVLSDDAEIPIPDTSSPITGVEIGFLINIASADTVTVQVTGAGSVTFGDIERFVSCHKAGDPTTGEAQTILGDKTFSDDVDIAGGLGVVEDAVFSADVEINGTLAVDGAVTEEDVTIGKTLSIIGEGVGDDDTCLIWQKYVQVGGDDVVQLTVAWPNIAADYGQILFGGRLVCQASAEISGALEVGGAVTMTSTMTLSGALTVEAVSEFKDDVTFSCNIDCGAFSVDADGNVEITSAGTLGAYGPVEIPGLSPSIVSNALQVPIGGIIGVCPSGVSGWAQDVPAGTDVIITAGLMPAAAWDCANARWGACPSGRTIPAGTYTCVTGWDYSSTGSTYGLVLLCRVS